jgi:hypothetical protein
MTIIDDFCVFCVENEIFLALNIFFSLILFSFCAFFYLMNDFF